MEKARCISIRKARGGRLSLSPKAFTKLLLCYRNFVLKKKVRKQGVFLSNNAYISQKRKDFKKCLLSLSLTFRSVPTGPGSKLTHPYSVGSFRGMCQASLEKEKHCICRKSLP